MSLSSDAPLPPPIPNSYWVQPGRLLAGEYPGSVSRADAMERVRKLLRAGITSFVDLTEEGELPPYDQLLPELTEQAVRYRRLPIVDHGLPDAPEDMARILDCVEGELKAGRSVYVHCHAGIGRTGTTMGCLLVRGGMANDAALKQLQILWQQCARSRYWPTIPETDAQIEFVRSWHELPSGARATSPGLLQRAEGSLIGLAIGDALGLVAGSRFDAATLAAGNRDPGALTTGAHTAMTRAVAESLLAVSAHDAEDQMRRYLQWTRDVGAAGVPPEMKRALGVWQWSRKANAGTHDPKNLDSHTLARSLAVALYMHAQASAAIDIAADVSRTTQQAPLVLDLCRFWAAQYVDALAGCDRSALTAMRGPALQILRKRTLKHQVRNLVEHHGPSHRKATGAVAAVPDDALGVTHAALDAFAGTTSFRDAVVHVASATRASPAAVALCGALAGAHYGADAIPQEWRRRLSEDAPLRSLARHLLS
jgi:protein-tyrosine phosphatase/ADP-ribosylglycohydrolase